MFGDEGKALEQEWLKECDGDDRPHGDGLYRWPKPSIETERWRYLTIKECNQVLRKPVPSKWDMRANLKRDYKSSYDELVNGLKDVLGDVADIDGENAKAIDRLAKRAAAIWLDLEMHRCRIVVRLTGTKVRSISEKVSKAQESSLVLTVMPTIGRYGNVEGAELETFTVIGGCEGEKLEIP